MLIFQSFLKSSMDKVALQEMLNTMVDNFSTLFTHVTSSSSISTMIGCLAHIQLLLIFQSFLKSSVDKVPLQGMLNTMVDNFSTLFTHVTSSSSITAMIGCLAQPMGELYQDVAKRTAVKVYNNAFQQKVCEQY